MIFLLLTLSCCVLFATSSPSVTDSNGGIATSQPVVLYVNQNGDDLKNSGTSKLSPLATIGAAMCLATTGSINCPLGISLGPQQNVQIVITTPSTLRGTGNVNLTIIESDATSSLSISSDSLGSAVIDGEGKMSSFLAIRGRKAYIFFPNLEIFTTNLKKYRLLSLKGKKKACRISTDLQNAFFLFEERDFFIPFAGRNGTPQEFLSIKE